MGGGGGGGGREEKKERKKERKKKETYPHGIDHLSIDIEIDQRGTRERGGGTASIPARRYLHT